MDTNETNSVCAPKYNTWLSVWTEYEPPIDIHTSHAVRYYTIWRITAHSSRLQILLTNFYHKKCLLPIVWFPHRILRRDWNKQHTATRIYAGKIPNTYRVTTSFYYKGLWDEISCQTTRSTRNNPIQIQKTIKKSRKTGNTTLYEIFCKFLF